MVQQLSLFDCIDDNSYDLLISTITTLSGNAPVLFARISTVWKPNDSFEIDRVNSKNQLVEPTRIKLTKSIPLSLLGGHHSLSYTLPKILAQDKLPVDSNFVNSLLHESNDQSDNSNSWALNVSDIPAAGSRKVSLQSISESVILSTGGKDCSITTFMNELGYISEYQYATIGVKFYLRHELTIELQKIWDLTRGANEQMTNGGFLTKAYVNVDKATDIERISQAETALLALQRELQGYVDLTMPDRKAMDSRMNYI
ncbi:hypothetical protein ZYGR_0I05430 [Zygosaccharomyces rouxii]|uniref:Mediator of RNA polymerase II transcription subunit 18 n=2 Tax=Zygosaccharomyces rouxii TaxID=4956 RepID=C5DU08_ZYGRC|nr:uncharacterized protein ZYRO0C12826g [Zygosaccharomyces rouxii]KAH9201555.1 mediator complex, subunit Med18 [Zygosaccharomyces rouxii]GAV48246.1 hypothetical protein ZYGR_0I05430 [Zygosaccharomyces rouxii]CAR27269.1 ZYRO0C12826p [Zygosaccharomyces rouxii]